MTTTSELTDATMFCCCTVLTGCHVPIVPLNLMEEHVNVHQPLRDVESHKIINLESAACDKNITTYHLSFRHFFLPTQYWLMISWCHQCGLLGHCITAAKVCYFFQACLTIRFLKCIDCRVLNYKVYFEAAAACCRPAASVHLLAEVCSACFLSVHDKS